MKTRNVFLIAFLILTCGIYGQIPRGFNYQAVLRDTSGEIIKNQPATLTINIIKGVADGNVVYAEEHNVTTNNLGLVNIVIGNGTTSDNFDSINWTVSTYFIETLLNGNTMGTQQLMSVPYALNAQESSTIEGYNTNDLQRILEDLQFITGLKIKDIDGNIYPTVRINNTLWMAEDLKTKRYADGREIVQYTTDMPDDTLLNYKLPFYYETPDTFNGDGLFYTLTAISDSTIIPYDDDRSDSNIIMQGICPEGWRLPNRTDLMQLFYLYDDDPYRIIDPAYLNEEEKSNSVGLNFNLNGERSYIVNEFKFNNHKSNGIYYMASNEYMEFRNDVIGVEFGGVWFGGAASYQHGSLLPVRCVKDLE